MQADPRQNFFELFDLPARYALDPVELATRYRVLQRRFHPDRYASRPDQERRLALQLTARINEAFQTLKDPVARGRYLLGLRGVDTGEESDTAMDPGFLGEQMELHEQLGEACGAPDAPGRLQQLAGRVSAAIASRTAELGRCLDADGAPSRARALVRELQFLAKLRSEIAERSPVG